jgi:hypothetical protein
MGLSIRAYARHRGVSDTAVHKAIKAGRITPEADGTIDPANADRQWDRNTDATQQRETASKARPAPKLAVMPEVPAVSTGAATASANAPLSRGGTSLLQAKTANEVLKAQTNKVRLARLKGELVDRSQAIAHVFKLARTERDAWLNWPARISAQMAAKLGEKANIDPHDLHVALEAAVREHLLELGEMRPRVD